MARVSLAPRLAGGTPCRQPPSQRLDIRQPRRQQPRPAALISGKPGRKHRQSMDQVSALRQSIRRPIPAPPATSMTSLVAKMTNRHQLTNRLLRKTDPNTAENTPPSTSSQNSTSLLQPPPPNYRKKKKVKLQPLGVLLPQCRQPRSVPPNQSCDVSDGIIHRHGILPPITVDGVASDCECGSDRTVGELSGYSSANDIHSDFTESDVTIDFLSASASNESLLDRSVSQQGRRSHEDDNRLHCSSPFPLCPPNSVSGSQCTDPQRSVEYLNKIENVSSETRSQQQDKGRVRFTDKSNRGETVNRRHHIRYPVEDQSDNSAHQQGKDGNQIEHNQKICNTSKHPTQNKETTGCNSTNKSMDRPSNSVQENKSPRPHERSRKGSSKKERSPLHQNNSISKKQDKNDMTNSVPETQKIMTPSKPEKCQKQTPNENQEIMQSPLTQNIENEVITKKGNDTETQRTEEAKPEEGNIQNHKEALNNSTTSNLVEQHKDTETLKNQECQTHPEDISSNVALTHLVAGTQSGRPLARVSPTRVFGPIPEGNGNLVVTRFSENQLTSQMGLQSLPIPPELQRILLINSGKSAPVQSANPAMTSDPISQCLQHMRTCHYAILCPPKESNKTTCNRNDTNKQNSPSNTSTSCKDASQDVVSKCSSSQVQMEPISVQGIQINPHCSTCHGSEVSPNPEISSDSTYSPAITGVAEKLNDKEVAKNSVNQQQRLLSERNSREQNRINAKDSNLKTRRPNLYNCTENIYPIAKDVSSPKKQVPPPPWKYTGRGSGIPPLSYAANSNFASPPQNGHGENRPKRRKCSNNLHKQVNNSGGHPSNSTNSNIKSQEKEEVSLSSKSEKPSCDSTVVSADKQVIHCDKSPPSSINEPHRDDTGSCSDKLLRKLISNETTSQKESICSLLHKLQSGNDIGTNGTITTVGDLGLSESGAELECVSDALETDKAHTSEEHEDSHISTDAQYPEGAGSLSTNTSPNCTENTPESWSCKRLPFQKSPIVLSSNLMVVPMSEAPRVQMVQPGSTTLEGRAVPGIRMILPTPLPPDLDD